MTAGKPRAARTGGLSSIPSPLRAVALGWAASLALLAALGWGRAEATAPRASIHAGLVLKVSSREDAADALVKKTEALEGYFATRTDDLLTVKVPIDQAQAFLAYAETLGLVADRKYDTEDLGFKLDQLRSRLTSREAVLTRYFEVMGAAGADGVISVEQEITRLVGEIENLKGSIRILEHQLQYAEVTVSFQFRDRAAPVSDGNSSFRWLNTVNLVDLVEDFRRARR